MTEPTWIMRAGFQTSSMGEIAATYTQAQLASGFHMRELAAGPVPNEDIRGVDITRDSGDVFDRLKIGQATFMLDNEGGTYTPASRAVFVPGKAITFKALTDQNSIYSLFSGHVVGYSLTPELGRRFARIECEDRMRELKRNARVPMLLDTKTSSLATEILDSIGVGLSDRTIDIDAEDDIPFSLVDNTTGGEALNELVQGGGHYVHGDGRGRVNVKGRTFDFFTTSVGSLTEFADLGYDLPLSRVINEVQIKSSPRAVATTAQTVAWLEESVEVASGATAALFVSWYDIDTDEREVPVTSLTTPVANSDWGFNAQADGGGTDLTSQASLVFTGFARSALVTITNNAGQTGYLTPFNVRGYPVRAVPAFAAQSTDDASIDRHGRRIHVIETDLIKTVDFAQAYGDLLLSQRKDPTAVIDVSIRNNWPLSLQLDLLGRVVVEEDNTSISTAWTVRGLDHQITADGGISHTVSYRMDIADQRLYLVLDKDPEGKLDTDRVLAP